MRYHVYARLKIVIKILQGKMKRKSATRQCPTGMLHFRVALSMCLYKVKQKHQELERGC